jgi:hypothetical protein
MRVRYDIMVRGGNLRRAVRQRIDAGELPCSHEKIWAGRGAEHLCAVCGELIPPTVTEYEVLFPGPDETTSSFYFHFECLKLWLEECTEKEKGRPSQS